MGDYGLNQTFQYSEYVFDSADSLKAAGSLTTPTVFDKLSWPLFYFTTKHPKVMAIKILQAEIPNFWDNVLLGFSTFVYNNGSGRQIVIPPGYYTGATLAAAAQARISAFTAGFTVTYDDVTKRFTFTQPLAIAWSLRFSTRRTPYALFGFPINVFYNATGIGSTIVSPGKANFNTPNYLYINSTTLGPLINFNLPNTSLRQGLQICRIPITAKYGETIFYNDPDPQKYFDLFVGGEFSNMDFFLTLGNEQLQIPLDTNGIPWSLKLGVLSYRDASPDIYEKPDTILSIKT